MDKTDKNILSALQNEFPICEEPFIKIGEKLGICEKEVLDRVNKLKSDGIIRRTGGVLDSKHLGYKSSLLALRVPPEDIEKVAEFINQFPGVTHNYQRSHTYNLWFTLSASSSEKFSQIVEIIKTKTGIRDILELPAINIFQHEVKFNL